MAELLSHGRLCCPLPHCTWTIDSSPASPADLVLGLLTVPAQFEASVRACAAALTAHLESHSVLEWSAEIARLRSQLVDSGKTAIAHFSRAMHQEGIAPETRRRVLDTVLYGHPDNSPERKLLATVETMIDRAGNPWE